MNLTITTTETGDPILTWPLRYAMTDALTEAIQLGRHGDHAAYLELLQHTAPDTVITADSELADVLTFFGLFEF
jgi:hypothetical protein